MQSTKARKFPERDSNITMAANMNSYMEDGSSRKSWYISPFCQKYEMVLLLFVSVPEKSSQKRTDCT